MKKIFFTVLSVFLISGFLLAQTRRIVLLEEATNAGCPPCASYNPGLQDFIASNFGGIISVRYHAWWPGSDPMYFANTAENKARIQYYGISGVPGYTIDGHFYGVPSNPDAMLQQMNDRLNIETSVELQVKAQYDADSVHIKINVIPLAEVTQTNVKLRVAIIERMITYVSAPGSNGEKNFGDVMRKMLPDAGGTLISQFTSGDTLRYSFSYPVDVAWIWQDLSVVAWLQSDDTKEVLQSAIDFPTFIIETETPDLDFLTADSAITRSFFIINLNDEAMDVRVYFKSKKITSGWNCRFINQGSEAEEIETQILPNDTLRFELAVTTTERGSAEVQIFAENLNDPAFYGEGYGYGFGFKYLGIVTANNDVLLVDDDGGESYESNFETIFHNLDTRYITIPQIKMESFTKQANLQDYKMVIWNTSWAFPAFTKNDIDILDTYLDDGGSLLVLGQDMGWDIFDSQGNSNFTEAQDFYHNYLGAAYLDDNSGGLSIVGVDQDPIGDGFSFSLKRPYGFSNFYPDEVTSYQGKATPVFKYNNDKIGGLKYDSGTHKAVYLAFGLEQIDGEDNRQLFLERTMEWAAGITGLSDEVQQVPARFSLEQNYPNPFNPTTVISYQVGAICKSAVHVELTVYNMLGQKVRTLVNENQVAGNYKVNFNAGELSSGVYVYKITTKSGFSESRKMLLMR